MNKYKKYINKEKDMSTISKKKSFWKEFYEHYKGGIKTALHILAMSLN